MREFGTVEFVEVRRDNSVLIKFKVEEEAFRAMDTLASNGYNGVKVEVFPEWDTVRNARQRTEGATRARRARAPIFPILMVSSCFNPFLFILFSIPCIDGTPRCLVPGPLRQRHQRRGLLQRWQWWRRWRRRWLLRFARVIVL